MRILCCGSRGWTDRDLIYWELFHAAEWPDPVEVIHGGARGADQISGEMATHIGMPVQVFPADWETHGKAAGPIRNREMLDQLEPGDLVLAFWDGRSRGTLDTIHETLSRMFTQQLTLRVFRAPETS